MGDGVSTNYYFRPRERSAPETDILLDHANPGRQIAPEVHIGKRAGGWAFMLHTFSTMSTWEDWRAVIESRPDWHIVDEYGREVHLDEMHDTVMAGGRLHTTEAVRRIMGHHWFGTGHEMVASPCGKYTCHSHNFS